MNVVLPPFKNSEHNSQSASTFDRNITRIIRMQEFHHNHWQTVVQFPAMAEYFKGFFLG